jgi:hypothetical protein
MRIEIETFGGSSEDYIRPERPEIKGNKSYQMAISKWNIFKNDYDYNGGVINNNLIEDLINHISNTSNINKSDLLVLKNNILSDVIDFSVEKRIKRNIRELYTSSKKKDIVELVPQIILESEDYDNFIVIKNTGTGEIRRLPLKTPISKMNKGIKTMQCLRFRNLLYKNEIIINNNL